MSNNFSYFESQGFIKKVNILLDQGKQNILSLNLKSFDSSLSSEDSSVCYESLVAHRFVGKFSLTVGNDQRQVAFDNYLSYDRDHVLTEFNIWQDGIESYYLRKARALLHTWLRRTSLVDLCEVEFTPGESYISSKGDVSIIGKLQNRSHWTTTDALLEKSCELVYNTLQLKRVAKYHIGHVSRSERRKLFSKYGSRSRCGYRIFRHLLIERVFTVVNGARASSVPKNTETDRFINVETTFGCIFQRAVASEFLRVLKRVGNDIRPSGNDGYDKSDAQLIHKRMIQDPSVATIDFSNASDSISRFVVSGMFPTHISSMLMFYRSHFVEIDGEEYEPNKLSSMGNGFTFETMTLLLLSIARTMDPNARVFGDDVIIANESADLFVRVCKIIGFNVNPKKTFIKSLFRESCGAFYHDHYGYFVSFDIKACQNAQDCVVVCNKLYYTIQQLHNCELKTILTQLHSEIRALYPASLRGPAWSTKALDAYVYDDRWARAHRRCRESRTLWKRYVDKVNQYNAVCSYSPIVGIALTYSYENKYNSFSDRTVKFASYLYAGRRVKRHIRGKGRFVLKPVFFTEYGSIHLSSFNFIIKQLKMDTLQ